MTMMTMMTMISYQLEGEKIPPCCRLSFSLISSFCPHWKKYSYHVYRIILGRKSGYSEGKFKVPNDVSSKVVPYSLYHGWHAKVPVQWEFNVQSSVENQIKSNLNDKFEF